MAVTVKNIIPRKQAEAVQSGQYAAANCKTIIDKFTVTNTSANNVQFSSNLIAAAGSASNANLVLDAKTIAPGETYMPRACRADSRNRMRRIHTGRCRSVIDNQRERQGNNVMLDNAGRLGQNIDAEQSEPPAAQIGDDVMLPVNSTRISLLENDKIPLS